MTPNLGPSPVELNKSVNFQDFFPLSISFLFITFVAFNLNS